MCGVHPWRIYSQIKLCWFLIVENGKYDPLNESKFIREEIDLWLAGVIKRNWLSVERLARGPNFNMEKSIASVLSGLGIKSRDILACLRKMEYPPMPSEWENLDYVD